ncbi:menaquinone biosynthesis decarboxylase [Caminibacter mediatlanticus]|uniref:3-POLYPRENYL-4HYDROXYBENZOATE DECARBOXYLASE n=1 Tax=Caminibacter mediatlanticus TB-2 TaxID=391592 RepID=A0AAI9F306_9BACT|nr:menaquinone biosynthesis decarboxylase [Caminibacter mediatlanticus]EDM24305.1 3-POLYPRENYL-4HYDROXYBENZOATE DECARBOXYLASE [Caminibacter mediatlanticus TB-2]
MRLDELKEFIEVIDTPLDVNLEIPHLAYIEAKKKNPKILMFTNPIEGDEKFDIPVVMNIFANDEVVKRIFGKELDLIAGEIESLIKMKPPKTLSDKLKMFGKLFALKNTIPKTTKNAECQYYVKQGEAVNLFDLPILKTWGLDGGKFITMGQVYTKSIDGEIRNVGMYRLQIYDKNRLGLHWQIHKDSAHLFWEYKKANKKMPVSIAIGGDPLYTWCATAPMPPGVFELMLYGFIRKENPKLVKGITNDLEVPFDSDIVIEGWCDPKEMEIEGMFGDHTGYYTLKKPFPVLKVSCITTKKDPVYYATVVGKPPLEDKYMGYATERIFLPLLKTTSPDLIDYAMPENGVFHNLILAKISPRYPGHSMQIMHSLWGVGQMSFVKHAIFVGDDAPPLRDYENLTRYILNNFDKSKVLISKGIVDELDHSSIEELVGGKLGVDITNGKWTMENGKFVDKNLNILSDEELLKEMKSLDESILDVRQYFTDTKNPICVVKFKKTKSAKEIFQKLKVLKNNLRIVVFINTDEIDNLYMLVWRVTNNIDALRDIWIDDIIGIDGSNKNSLDGFDREWPPDVDVDEKVIKKLFDLGLIKDITKEELIKYQILEK